MIEKEKIAPGMDADLTIMDQDKKSDLRVLQRKGDPGSMKCAVSDFDRTLYVNGAVSERNIEAVKQWQRKGNLFFIATGRNLASIKERIWDFLIWSGWLILNNGAAIMDKEGKLLLCRIIEKKTALKILRFLHELNEDGSGVSMTR